MVMPHQLVNAVVWLSASFAIPMRGKCIPVVIRVELHEHGDLPQIAETGDADGLCLGPGKRGQEHAGQDGDDGNHHPAAQSGKTASPTRGRPRHSGRFPPRLSVEASFEHPYSMAIGFFRLSGKWALFQVNNIVPPFENETFAHFS